MSTRTHAHAHRACRLAIHNDGPLGVCARYTTDDDDSPVVKKTWLYHRSRFMRWPERERKKDWERERVSVCVCVWERERDHGCLKVSEMCGWILVASIPLPILSRTVGAGDKMWVHALTRSDTFLERRRKEMERKRIKGKKKSSRLEACLERVQQKSWKFLGQDSNPGSSHLLTRAMKSYF